MTRLRGDAKRYGPVARLFHWTVAALLLVQAVLGYWLAELDYYDPWLQQALALHRLAGLALLALVAARLAWLTVDTRPQMDPRLAAWERLAARCAHAGLYLLLLVVPLLGWLLSGASGNDIKLAIGTAPSLIALPADLADLAGLLHKWLAYGLLALVALHAAAALKHRFIDRVDILRRML